MPRYTAVLFIVALMALASAAMAQEKEIKHVPVKPTSAASGSEMYKTYCAVCHGADAKGAGPAAEALKAQPTDLTSLSKKNGGKYPSDTVANTIRGDARVLAHGTKDMPIWGNLFWHMSGGHPSEVQLRVANLNKYVESLQEK
ncbi:MAG TPA: c-type cytochrome [Terriglobales bacterium]|nr:c-type cytochrome [Terriglobales bacterium]